MDEFIKTLRAAIRHHQQGDLAQAETLYREVLEQQPQQSLALHSLGLIAYQQQRHEEAIDLVMQAIEVDPATPHLHNSIGVMREALGQSDQAIEAYQQAIRLKHDYTEAHKNLGIAYRNQQRVADAIQCFQNALSFDSAHIECHVYLADLFVDCQRHAEAVVNYQTAVMLNPNLAEVHNNLAIALKHQARFDEALDAQQKAIELRPENINFQTNLASILQAQGNLTEAVACCQQVVTLAPDNATHYYNLACVLRDQGALAEAIASNNQALDINPQFPEAHWNQAICTLMNGDFQQGWSHFQWRRQAPHQYQYPHHHPEAIWQGGPFDGRLFIHCEQGLGDAIQFIRYLPQVKALGGEVTVGVWEALIQLCANFPGIDQLIPLSRHKKPEITCDLHCSLLDLPGIFTTGIDSIPKTTPYFAADLDKREHFKGILTGSGLKIGLAWAGSARHANDANRSMPLDCLAPLADLESIQIYSLQKDIRDIRIKNQLEGFGIVDLAGHLTDFTDTAAVIANLDLVITVDTALLHLAGALGKRTWGLIPYSPDWRWMLERKGSPWYPTLTLFRQNEPGDWQGVVTRVVNELTENQREAK